MDGDGRKKRGGQRCRAIVVWAGNDWMGMAVAVLADDADCRRQTVSVRLQEIGEASYRAEIKLGK